MPEYKLAVVIGRFQPFHNGHHALIERACDLADRVLVLIGSSNKSPSIKNPFPTGVRQQMIWNSFGPKISTEELFDYPYNNDYWIAKVQERVNTIAVQCGAKESEIVLLGGFKDRDSWYLNSFPMWDFKAFNSFYSVSATELRDHYFGSPNYALWQQYVPESTQRAMNTFRQTSEYDRLREEWNMVENYKDSWSVAPYPPIFVTVDAVVICAGHVLLIKRKFAPGKGLWALPGGFVGQNEHLEDAAVRELKEETAISLTKTILKNRIEDKAVFDHPDRSVRGRTISHSFFFKLFDSDFKKLDIAAESDASDVRWFTLNEVFSQPTMMFEDHSDQIHWFVNRNN